MKRQLRTWRGCIGLLALLALTPAAPAAAQASPRSIGDSRSDDVVPAAIDALLAKPDDIFIFGIPLLADGETILTLQGTGSGRCLADVGDVTGDGAPDFALGVASGGPGGCLQVRDGQTGAVLWDARPDQGAFRTLRGLAAEDGRLALGLTSPHGRVEVRAAATGALLWGRNLLPVATQRPANVLAVEWTEDFDRDGKSDVLVAGGRLLEGVWLLSGADGATLWHRDVRAPVADARLTGDLDGDGVGDVVAVGGLAAPFACAVSGAHGALLWQVALPAPGSAVLPLADIDRDGLLDLVVGMFAEPGSCLIALGGAQGDMQWQSDYAIRNVTALTEIGDIDGDGLSDVAMGSLDNAVAGVLAASGLLHWRAEGSIYNGGSMLAVASAGDVNGNGSIDVYTSSMDKRVYILDGGTGYAIGVHDLRTRGVAVAALGDADGDGRREILAAGNGTLHEVRGSAGTAAGPVVVLQPPAFLGDNTHLDVYAYPSSGLVLLGSLGTGHLVLPGYTGALGLDLASAGLLHVGTAPGAGLSGHNFGGLPRSVLGLTLHFQAVTTYAPGRGAFSKVVSHVWTF